MTAPKLSAEQWRVLKAMASGDGTLRRYPGGFWKWSNDDGSWTGTTTQRALESRGMIERTNEFPEVWKDTRRITDAGRKALEEREGECESPTND